MSNSNIHQGAPIREQNNQNGGKSGSHTPTKPNKRGRTNSIRGGAIIKATTPRMGKGLR